MTYYHVRRAMRRAFVGILALLGIYEAVALYTTERGDTISEVVWAVTDDPTAGKLVTLLAGIVLGHFFWPRRQ